MILFCDTSALVKLYIEEEFSSEVRDLTDKATVIAASRISWAQAMATFARRVRESPVDTDAIDSIRDHLRADWSDFAIVEVTQQLVELAGEYADTFALRGFDSVQLASARMLQVVANEAFYFACFEARLRKAASVLGMLTLGKQ